MARRTVGGRWIVIQEGHRARWGGDIRRRHLFSALAARTGATVVDAGTTRATTRALVAAARGPRWKAALRPFRALPSLASTEQLSERTMPSARRWTDPVAVAIYDDAIAQLSALGVTIEQERIEEIRRRRDLNETTFRWHVVPTASFAELTRLDPARVIVGGNATDAANVRPGPWPSAPAVGVVSGAAPGRGLEALIGAVRLVRGSIGDVRLLLWLVATSKESGRYLENLKRDVAGEPWIEIAAASYERLGDELQRATILCIPHPANDYMDVALPVKLFDSMAAGRPLVVTPRTETRAIVDRYGFGIVTSGDRPEDLADGISRLLDDETLAHRLGDIARVTAETVFDWPIVSGRIADEILRREGIGS